MHFKWTMLSEQGLLQWIAFLLITISWNKFHQHLKRTNILYTENMKKKNKETRNNKKNYEQKKKLHIFESLHCNSFCDATWDCHVKAHRRPKGLMDWGGLDLLIGAKEWNNKIMKIVIFFRFFFFFFHFQFSVTVKWRKLNHTDKKNRQKPKNGLCVCVCWFPSFSVCFSCSFIRLYISFFFRIGKTIFRFFFFLFIHFNGRKAILFAGNTSTVGCHMCVLQCIRIFIHIQN